MKLNKYLSCTKIARVEVEWMKSLNENILCWSWIKIDCSIQIYIVEFYNKRPTIGLSARLLIDCSIYDSCANFVNRQEHAVLGVDASGKVASFALRALLPIKYFAFIITHIFQSGKTFWLSIIVSGSPFRHKRKSLSVEPPFHHSQLNRTVTRYQVWKRVDARRFAKKNIRIQKISADTCWRGVRQMHHRHGSQTRVRCEVEYAIKSRKMNGKETTTLHWFTANNIKYSISLPAVILRGNT